MPVFVIKKKWKKKTEEIGEPGFSYMRTSNAPNRC